MQDGIAERVAMFLVDIVHLVDTAKHYDATFIEFNGGNQVAEEAILIPKQGDGVDTFNQALVNH